MSAADQTDRLRAYLQAMGWPTLTVVDVAWAKDDRYAIAVAEFGRLLGSASATYIRHQQRTGSPGAVAKLVHSELQSQVSGSTLVVLLAPTTRDWQAKKSTLTAAISNAQSAHLLVLSKAALSSATRALEELCDLLESLKSRSQPKPDPASATAEFAARLVSATGITTPIVLVVCGNESQRRDREAYPDRVLAEFGIRGEWFLTDYSHPEKAVAAIKHFVDREVQEDGKYRTVLVLFSQMLNATNVKRDGQAALRERGIHSLTPTFKSLGSALKATRDGLETVYLSDTR